MRYRELFEQAKPFDNDTVNAFTHGYCVYLALALYDIAGFTIEGSIDEDSSINHCWNVVAQSYPEVFVDINGQHREIPNGWVGEGDSVEDISDRITTHYTGSDPKIEKLARDLVKQNPAYFGIEKKHYPKFE